jgi:hypothetical protein
LYDLPDGIEHGFAFMRTSCPIALIVCLLLPTPPSAAAAEDTTEGLEQAARDARDRARKGYERLSRRRTFDIDGVPYGATGLPITFFTPSSCLHYGGWLEVANYSREPYAYRANVQWYLTTKGKRNHHMRLEFPTPFGFPVNARILTRDLKNTGASFFGIGNDTKISDERTDREPEYYRNLLEQQLSAFDLEFAEIEPLVIFGGVRFNRGVPSRINEKKANAYYVFNLTDREVLGRSGGWANFLLVGAMYDSRDDQEMPTAGLLSEASFQMGGTLLGADYAYRRMTLINTHYWRPPWPFRLQPLRRRHSRRPRESWRRGALLRADRSRWIDPWRAGRWRIVHAWVQGAALRRSEEDAVLRRAAAHLQERAMAGPTLRDAWHVFRRCGARGSARCDRARSIWTAPERGHRLSRNVELSAQPSVGLRVFTGRTGVPAVLPAISFDLRAALPIGVGVDPFEKVAIADTGVEVTRSGVGGAPLGVMCWLTGFSRQQAKSEPAG